MEDFQSLKRKVEDGTATENELIRFAKHVENTAKEEIEKQSHHRSAPDESVYNTVWQIIRSREERRARSVWANRRTSLLVAASVFVAMAAMVFIIIYKPHQEEILAFDSRTVVVKGKDYVHLPDGSTVLLNDSSSLTYESNFGEQDRIIRLDGQGYFDVAHDPAKPFKVLTGDITTTVLGTAFDVRAYFNQEKITVTVSRGRVSVKSTKREFGDILPNESLAISKLSKEAEKREIVAEEELAWKSQFLVFDDITVESAVTKVAERFNKRIAFADGNVKLCKINVAFIHGETLDEMMHIISGIVQAQYEVREHTITVSGGRLCQ